MHDGVWLGLLVKSDEHIIGTPNGIVRARTVRRLTPDRQWSAEARRAIRGPPRQPDPSTRSLKIPAVPGVAEETDIADPDIPAPAAAAPEEPGETMDLKNLFKKAMCCRQFPRPRIGRCSRRRLSVTTQHQDVFVASTQARGEEDTAHSVDVASGSIWFVTPIVVINCPNARLAWNCGGKVDWQHLVLEYLVPVADQYPEEMMAILTYEKQRRRFCRPRHRPEYLN